MDISVMTSLALIVVVLFSISLFVIVPAHAVNGLHFDQPKIIMLDHSDVITYISDTKTPLNDVLISGGTAGDMSVPLFQVPESTTVWRNTIKFTTCAANDLLALKYCVADRNRITISNNGGSDDVTISSVNTTPSYGVARSSNNPVTCLNDMDTDGICDEWEDVGGGNHILTIPSIIAGQVPYTFACTDLPCGSDKKDIFVEIDYMNGHRPNQQAIDAVVDAFAHAPSTPSGGIRLHVQVDESETTIGHITNTRFPGSNTSPLQGFDQIKAIHFGTLEERTLKENYDWHANVWKQKKQAFHYFLFAHSQTGTYDKSSGNAEILGNDGIVSLGTFDGQIGNPDQQAGTFMHELGHNLNLNHGGGPADDVNCKPNYLSVMSYSRQFNELGNDRTLDFSSMKIPSGTLRESALKEYEGTGAVYDRSTEKMIWNKASIGQPENLATGVTASNIDWNGGDITPAPSTVSSDLNKIGTFCPSGTYNTYSGYDDWENINLKFKQSSGNFADGRTSGGPSTTLDVRSNICPPTYKFVTPSASEKEINRMQKLHRVCGSGLGASQTVNSIDSVPIVIEKENYQSKSETSSELPDPTKEEEASYIKEFLNKTWPKGESIVDEEFSSDAVFEIRMIRIDQLVKQVESIDEKLLEPKLKEDILKQYQEARDLIGQDELALAYDKLNGIDYTSIKDEKLARHLQEDTNNVNKIFSEAPPKKIIEPCTFGFTRIDGVCVTDYSIEIIIISIVIITIIVLMRVRHQIKNRA